MKFGFKLWSTNVERLEEAQKFYAQGLSQFVELYAVPGSFLKTREVWKKLDQQVVLHAPHFGHGLNLSLRECRDWNRKLLEETKAFCDHLNAKSVIVHLGTKGTLEESITQLLALADSRFLVENKPQIALDGTQCVGASPQEIQNVMQQCGLGFCLDFSHAIKFARTHHYKDEEILQAFLKLSPTHYHLCDGHTEILKDEHENIGDGNYDVAALMRLLLPESWVTLETHHFEQDIQRLKTMQRR